MVSSARAVRRVIGFGALALVALSQSAGAQEVTEQQIVRALMPPPKTRGLTLGGPTQAAAISPDKAFVDSLRGKPTRSLTLGDRAKLDSVAADKPAIDLVMEFDFNSDVLRGEALATADKLGKALSSPELRGQTFMIGGHTDAKGGEDPNQKLSERRADAVKRYLVQAYRIPADTLIGVGYGKSHLKNADDPFGRENRRVQAVNMLQVKTAER
ncbi:OmpA family protein [Methylobacterium sp. C25]|nr:OmpA family protein [Methylobacterium sp. C25]